MTLRNGGWPAAAILVVFALVWTGLTLTADLGLSLVFWQQARTLHYQTTSGTVVCSQVAITHDSEGSGCDLDIRYAYEVQGKPYESTRFRTSHAAGSCQWVHATVTALPVGQPITVYYDPEQPAEAVLMPGLALCDVLITIFMAPFNMIMLGAWSGVGYLFRMLLAGELPPDMRLIAGPHGQIVRLPGFPPLIAGMFALTLTSIIAALVLAFGFTMHGPIWPAILGWGVILAASATAVLRTYQEQRSGQYDLLIDDSRQLVALPQRRSPRDPPAWIPIADLERTEVFEEVTRDSEGERYQYIVRLVTHDRRRHKIHTWTWEQDAERFAVWLAKRLGLAL